MFKSDNRFCVSDISRQSVVGLKPKILICHTEDTAVNLPTPTPSPLKTNLNCKGRWDYKIHSLITRTITAPKEAVYLTSNLSLH